MLYLFKEMASLNLQLSFIFERVSGSNAVVCCALERLSRQRLGRIFENLILGLWPKQARFALDRFSVGILG